MLAAMSGMEREYIRDRTLEGHEPARKRGKTIGGAGVTDESMLSMALHLRAQEMSLRDIAKRLVITTGAKKGHDLGASFAWNNASYPPRGVENFGDDGTNDLADLLAVLLADLFGGEMPHPDRVLAALARTSPADAVDLLWMVAAERADVQEAGVLAEMGAQAAALAERANAGDAPNWPADAADDQEFLARLTGELTAGRAQSVPPQETFGGALWRTAGGHDAAAGSPGARGDGSSQNRGLRDAVDGAAAGAHCGHRVHRRCPGLLPAARRTRSAGTHSPSCRRRPGGGRAAALQ
ncbi:hypothetical protein [Streptomyces europaeiscabiei]|uniref:hypothetical protein n=1 Tax=Streptomyces europaeiscabiei TaxID=146819 RepID=UPI002E12C573|nr:recombinase family protein [Streptomyces europaeiscabiei]